MTQPPPDDTPDLAKPASPSGDQPPSEAPPTPFDPPPTSPYASPQQGHPQQGQPSYQPSYGQPQQPYAGYPPQGGSPYGAYPPQPGMPGYPFAQSHSGANTAMGLGITSVVCALLTFACCLAAVGTLTGPFAIALAVRARKEMAQSPGLYRNDSAALTGLITGVIGTVVGLLAIALVVFFFGTFLALGSGDY